TTAADTPPASSRMAGSDDSRPARLAGGAGRGTGRRFVDGGTPSGGAWGTPAGFPIEAARAICADAFDAPIPMDGTKPTSKPPEMRGAVPPNGPSGAVPAVPAKAPAAGTVPASGEIASALSPAESGSTLRVSGIEYAA